MKKGKVFSQISTAIVTPFNCAGALNVKVVPSLVRHITEYGGIKGLFVCGWCGEGSSMTVDERKLMSEAVMKSVSENVSVMVHVGATVNIDDAVQLAIHAKNLGANAISAMPHVSLKGDLKGIFKYYRYICDSVDLPFYVYWRYDLFEGITYKEFLAEIRNIPTFEGIKYLDHNLYQFERMIEYSDRNMVALSGYDEVCLAAMILGSKGAIGATFNAMPKSFVLLRELFKKKELESAKDLQIRINNLIEKMLEYGVIASVKAIYKEIYGIDVGGVREPYKEISEKQIMDLVNTYKQNELA